MPTFFIGEEKMQAKKEKIKRKYPRMTPVFDFSILHCIFPSPMPHAQI